MNKIIICFLFMFLFLFSITALDNNIKKTLSYTCILNNVENVASSKEELGIKVKDFLAGYALGINFHIDKKSVKLLTNGELNFLDKEFNIKEKRLNNVNYLIEIGKYKYSPPHITDYTKKYTIRVTKKGNDFWKIYKSLLIYCLKSRLKNTEKGVILPQGDLDVILTNNNTIIITETFTVYVK